MSMAPTDRETTSKRVSPGSWTLRTRLVVALVALLAVTITVVGVLTIVALDRFLIGQLDDQLTAASTRARVDVGRGPDSRRNADSFSTPGRAFPIAPGQATGTLGAVVVNGRVVRAAVLDSSGSPQPLPLRADSGLTNIHAFGEPQSEDLGDGLGNYRVVATPGTEGSVLVTGLQLNSVDQTVQQVSIIITVVAVVGLVVAGVAAAAIISISLRPLRRVAATATQVAGMPLDSDEVALAIRVPTQDTDPRTEVGQVGSAINHMLENVAAALQSRHESEQRVRSFVADASHELRTPLASIRGYAELTRRGDAELPPDARNSLARIESESIRMTSLVEDLLLLARLDADRPIEFTPVDLSALVIACVSDAHVAGPDHQWQLRVAPEPVIVSGDTDRLHQVIANLLTNARVHTPPGSTVTISLERTAAPTAASASAEQFAELRVHDDGPGIQPELLPEVFGRFSRGDSSRSRAAGSTGLGLAIVSAVVEAHHGRISVDSRPGSTTFVLQLPARTT